MEIGKCHGARHLVTAADVTAGVVKFTTDFSAPLGAIVAVRDAAGAVKLWGGVITIVNGQVGVLNNGSVDFADTDKIDIIWF